MSQATKAESAGDQAPEASVAAEADARGWGRTVNAGGKVRTMFVDTDPQHVTRRQRLVCVAATAAPTFGYVIFVLGARMAPVVDVGQAVLNDLISCLALWVLLALVWVASVIALPLVRGDTTKRPLEIVADALRARWNDDYFVSTLWPPLMLGILLGVFGVFKETTLRDVGFEYDRAFIAIDRMLFLGTDPWRIAHRLSPPWITLIIDRLYHGWFAPMSVGVLVCGLARSQFELRIRYMVAFVATWIVIGTVMAYLLPAAGPCYADVLFQAPPHYSDLVAVLKSEQARAGPFNALARQDYLLSLYRLRMLGIGGGISAMPSMHVALATLFAAAAFKIGRTLGWITTAYALVIYFGSVDLGWHYAIDGIVGGGTSVCIWLGAGRAVAWLLRRSQLPGITAEAAI